MKPRRAVRLDRTIGWAVYPLHRWVYRATNGRIGHRTGSGPVLLLTTTGRKSGEDRTRPLLYMIDGDDYVVVASNAGRPNPPAWSLNLRADPSAEAQVGRRHLPVRARFVTRADDPTLWARLDNHYQGYAHYQSLTDREIPAVVLQPGNE